MFDHEVTPLNVTEVLQDLPKGSQIGGVQLGGDRFRHADPNDPAGLLRVADQRPSRCPDQKLPPLHSITSSACACKPRWNSPSTGPVSAREGPLRSPRTEGPCCRKPRGAISAAAPRSASVWRRLIDQLVP